LPAAAIIFDAYENQDARLVSLRIPDKVIRTFPGPAYGPAGIRKMTDWPDGEPAFGTILKPTAVLTPQEVGDLIGQVSRCPLFLSVKEDEDLYPNPDYSPAAERTRRAMASMAGHGDRGLSSPPTSAAPRTSYSTRSTRCSTPARPA